MAGDGARERLYTDSYILLLAMKLEDNFNNTSGLIFKYPTLAIQSDDYLAWLNVYGGISPINQPYLKKYTVYSALYRARLRDSVIVKAAIIPYL